MQQPRTLKKIFGSKILMSRQKYIARKNRTVLSLIKKRVSRV